MIEKFQNFADRSRQYDEVRVIGSRGIHYLQLPRSVEHRRFIDTCDSDLRETTFKRQTQRSADQTDAKDCDPLGKTVPFHVFPFSRSSRSICRHSSMIRSNKRCSPGLSSGPEFVSLIRWRISCSRSGSWTRRFWARLIFPISMAHFERSFSNSTSFLSISSIFRRQSSMVISPTVPLAILRTQILSRRGRRRRDRR